MGYAIVVPTTAPVAAILDAARTVGVRFRMVETRQGMTSLAVVNADGSGVSEWIWTATVAMLSLSLNVREWALNDHRDVAVAAGGSVVIEAGRPMLDRFGCLDVG